MAYLSNYTYDIFISYSHVDNESILGQHEGWIESFYKNLNLMLAKRLGKMDAVRIWWDHKKLDGSKLFDESIETGIQQSAIMLSLVSPGYLASDYCRKELHLFYKKICSEPTGHKIGDRSRILNVLLNNVHHTKWPEELKGTTGFAFHDAAGEEEFGDPLDAGSPVYIQQLKHLRDAIVNLLESFPASAEANTHTITTIHEEEKKAEPFSIYFGEVADTLRTIRRRTIAELEKKGYTIFCGVPPPDEEIAHQKKVLECMERANLSVHLFDQYPGKEIVDKPDVSYPQRQAELALTTEKPKLIWMPDEINIDDVEEDNYKLFLESLEDGKKANGKYEFIKGARSSVSQYILDMAEQMKVQLQTKAASAARLAVLLDTHYNDQLYAMDIGKTLLENDIQPFINPQEDDPRKNINILEDRISQVSKLIFFYGRVSRDWVLERMSAALQLIVTHNFPVEGFLVYMVPPHKDPNDISLRQRFLKVNVIDNSDAPHINRESFALLLKELKGHPA
jgi:hypothetical protein